MGVKFLQVSAELEAEVEGLLGGRRDMQYLWSLIESNVGKV